MLEKERNKVFRKTVLAHYKKQGRHDLPWRASMDPYRIAVSELMLQQTQVSRVVPKYNEFIKKFPTISRLAKAPLAQVLTAWSGLGYNRRAKYLHQLAQVVVHTYNGAFPRSLEELKKLPGIGDYTAGAIMAFAFNAPVHFIETNIRTVFIHHFFKTRKKPVSDKELFPSIIATLDTKNPRIWYWSLMDYGAFLKQKGSVLHRKSAHYKKQSAFKGSRRQIRGASIRLLANGPQTSMSLFKKLSPFSKERLEEILQDLILEGMIEKKGRIYRLAGS